MSVQTLQGATSKKDKVLLLLKNGLSNPIRRFGQTFKGLNEMLNLGDLPSILDTVVPYSLRRVNYNNDYNFEKNVYANKTWYCFAGANKKYIDPISNAKILHDKIDDG